ncbi:MAG: conserved rane protein [Glaciihabitans sp.]|nr:conserved rane protein [Glaciihabitans sp.]
MSFNSTNLTPGTTPPSASGASRTIRTYPNYLEAQAAVDFLSDSGFPVEHVDIVGRDIRLVESVSGRLTITKAALAGAAGGAWFGLLIGLLLGIFTPAIAWFVTIVGAVVIAAVWGAVLGAVSHWATRGRRDFTSTQRLEADHYDVLVDTAHAAEAERVLGDQPLVASKDTASRG